MAVSLAKSKKRSLLIFDERVELLGTKAQQANNICRGAVAEANPDHLRRWPAQDAEPLKVLVLTDENESGGLGMLPDVGVRPPTKAGRQDARRLRKHLREEIRQATGEVLVEQQLHAELARRRSRSLVVVMLTRAHVIASSRRAERGGTER